MDDIVDASRWTIDKDCGMPMVLCNLLIAKLSTTTQCLLL
jgi:hypothetical protein